MISSMTGYGRGESDEAARRYVVELRSENNRFLEIYLRLPKTLASLEPKIKSLIQEYVTRGRIYVTLNIDGTDENAGRLTLDETTVRSYCDALSEVKRKFRLSGKITLDILTRFPNILNFETVQEDVEEEWSRIEPALRTALKSLKGMREAEGTQLRTDLEKRIRVLESLIQKIEEESPKGVVEAKKKLEERLKSLLETDHIDPLRMALEVGIIAERCDVTEECVRFHSHNRLFRDTLERGGAIGKRLNFLLQEMNREANTIGSKGFNTTISHIVVQIKEEIEKLREQVQNIE